jgi:hypothetical protein
LGERTPRAFQLYANQKKRTLTYTQTHTGAYTTQVHGHLLNMVIRHGKRTKVATRLN